MRATERHEIETNELADTLNKYLREVQPYSKAILGVVILVVVGGAFFAYTAQERRKANERAWDDFHNAFENRDELRLAKVAERHPETLAGLWALQSAADRQLDSGSNKLYTDRKDGERQLQEAKKNYQAVVGKARDPMLLSRAQLGLAQTLESLGDLSDAEKYYAAAAKSQDKTLADFAKSRMDDLSREETKSLYAWFAKVQPASTSSSHPSVMPHSLESLGDRPDISSFPGSDLELPKVDGKIEPKPEDDKKPGDKPADEKPADKPADEKKPEDKPADEKPADEKKPADKPADEKKPEGKPADEKPADEKKPDNKPADVKPEDKKSDDKPAEEKKPDSKPADDKKANEEKPADSKPTDPAK